jgi:hypothetical protein
MRAPDFLRALLRGDPVILRNCIEQPWRRLFPICIALIIGGAGIYGAAMGWWRCGMQALYTGIKIPLVILLTTLLNSLLNAILAPLLGLNLSYRQSFAIILMTFTIASVLLATFAPIAFFVVWNTPPLHDCTRLVSPEYGFLQLCHVAFIAFAGVTGNVRLLPLLEAWAGGRMIGRKVLLAWLAGNLFLGSQICWVLRPFIWDPARPVEFVGREAFRGSFYETVFEALRRLVFG